VQGAAGGSGAVRRNAVSKVKVIEETIRYIDELHRALAKRVQVEAESLANSDDAVDCGATPTADDVIEAAKTVFAACVRGGGGCGVLIDDGFHDNGCHCSPTGCIVSVTSSLSPPPAAAAAFPLNLVHDTVASNIAQTGGVMFSSSRCHSNSSSSSSNNNNSNSV
jgi:hypothetical protein